MYKSSNLENSNARTEEGDVVIMMGASDPCKPTLTAMEAINMMSTITEVKVIVGKANQI